MALITSGCGKSGAERTFVMEAAERGPPGGGKVSHGSQLPSIHMEKATATVS